MITLRPKTDGDDSSSLKFALLGLGEIYASGRSFVGITNAATMVSRGKTKIGVYSLRLKATSLGVDEIYPQSYAFATLLTGGL